MTALARTTNVGGAAAKAALRGAEDHAGSREARLGSPTSCTSWPQFLAGILGVNLPDHRCRRRGLDALLNPARPHLDRWLKEAAIVLKLNPVARERQSGMDLATTVVERVILRATEGPKVIVAAMA